MTRAAYLIIALDVRDTEPFRRYEREILPVLQEFGGAALAATNSILLEDGQWPRRRIAVIQFPSRQHAEDFYQSPGNQRLKALRQSASEADVILAESPGDQAMGGSVETTPPHYILGGVTIMDPGWIGQYMGTVPLISARFGVEGLVMGNEFTVLEGVWPQSSAVLLKLPSHQAFEDFWRGEDYRPMKELREANSLGDHISFAGVIEPV